MSLLRGSVWLASGVVVGVVSAAMTVLRSIPSTSDLLGMVTAFSPYVLLGYGQVHILAARRSLRLGQAACDVQ